MNYEIPVLIAMASGFMAAFVELFPPLQKAWNDQFSSAQKQAVVAIIAVAFGVGSMWYNCSYSDVCILASQADASKAIIDLVLAVMASLGGAVVGHQSSNAKNMISR
jgi:hypothetical protein